jgi:hypothetical protein
MKTHWKFTTCAAVLCILFCFVKIGSAVASKPDAPISTAVFFGGADLFRGKVLSTTFLDDAPRGCRYVHTLKVAIHIKGAGTYGEIATLCAGTPLVPGTDYLIAAFSLDRFTPEEVRHIQDVLHKKGVTSNQLLVAAEGKSFRLYSVRHLSAADEEYLVIPDGLVAVPDNCVAETKTETIAYSTGEGTERRFLHARWQCILESIVSNVTAE